MGRTLDTNQYLDAVCRMLEDGATTVPVPVTGVSMRPFLRAGDFVYVELPGEKIRKGDILLFQRPNGQYILHRVVKCRKDGYLMLGDSQLEREPIHSDWVRAKAVSAKIQGQVVAPGSFRWWMFSHPWRWLSPWRRQIGWLHNHLWKR